MTIIALVLFALGVALGLGIATVDLRDDRLCADVWEAAYRSEVESHARTLAQLQAAAAERDIAAAQVATQAAIAEAGAHEAGPQPVRVGDDVHEHFCWN